MANTDTREVGRAIHNCCHRIGALLELRDAGAITAYLQNGQFCGARLCPFCEWRRSLAWRARMHRGLQRFAADHPTHRAVFLTLTVKNCRISELRQTIRDIHEGWKRLTKLAEFPTGHWLRKTEVTVASPKDSITEKGKVPTGNFPAADRVKSEDDPQDSPKARLPMRSAGEVFVHPHAHALLLVPSRYYGPDYIAHRRWRELWQMSARLDYPPIVHVEAVYSDAHKRSTYAPLAAVVPEAAKYISKAADVVKLGPFAAELHWQLKGLRMIQASRKFSAYVRNEEPSKEEMLDSLEGINPAATFMPVLAEWCEELEAYQLAGQPDAQDWAAGQ
jgi:plasmid rolling circle replication initiator protein Rep